MKRALLSMTLISFISVATFAQTRFGVTAGIAVASQKWKQDNVSVTLDGKVGFTIGVLADVSVAEGFTFQPGLNFTQKGGKLKNSGSELKQTLNYLELPLNFLYNAPAGNGKFFAGLGPVLGYGIGGKSKSGDVEEDIKFGSGDEDDYKPFEVAGNLLAGYEFSNGFFVAANYNMGLTNIANTDDNDDGSVKNRYFGIRIGFKFGSK